MTTARSSRRSSRAVVALLAVAAIAAGTRVSAHRLAELLPAARIAVEPDRVMLEMSLTPGTAVAEKVIGDIDANRDGMFSTAEKQAYVDRAVGALVLRVDGGQRLQMAITASEVPDAAAMREGDGVVAIRAEAAGSRWPAGSHQLHFRNEHDPGDSVYLANALVPENDEVMVTAQHRDADQRALTIAFAVAPATEGSSQWPWFAGGAFGCAWLLRRIGGHRRLHA